MFTGIVKEIGIVKEMRLAGKTNILTINCEKVLNGINKGDSISVNGVCLTVVEKSNKYFSADVMPETIKRASLKELVTGSKVNLEPALRLGDSMGGHIVQGHVDGVGEVIQIKREENAIWMKISSEPGILKYIVMKGSVAIEGVSLTVAEVNGSDFCVSLIPETARMTILGNKKIGDSVNIETDIIGKYVEKIMKPGVDTGNSQESKLSKVFLSENGFI